MTPIIGCPPEQAKCQLDLIEKLEVFERLVRLEEKLVAYKESTEKALVLAKLQHDQDRLEYAHGVEVKLVGYNQWQQRFDKIEGTLVTFIHLEREVKIARDTTEAVAKVLQDKHGSDMMRVNDDIRELRESKAELSGKASQRNLNVTTIVAVIGMIIGLLGLVHSFASK